MNIFAGKNPFVPEPKLARDIPIQYFISKWNEDLTQTILFISSQCEIHIYVSVYIRNLFKYLIR